MRSPYWEREAARTRRCHGAEPGATRLGQGLQLLASLLYVHCEPHEVAAQELQVTPPAVNTRVCLLPQQPRFLTLGFGCVFAHTVAMQISLIA